MLTALERALGTGGAMPTVRELARTAGVAIGSVYYYVREREDLVELLLRTEEHRIVARMLQALEHHPITTPSSDIRAVVEDLVQWRTNRGWVARLPMRFLMDRSWVDVTFRSAVQVGSQVLDAIAGRHGIKTLTEGERLHLVGLGVGNQLAWALEMGGAAESEVLVRLVGGYLDDLLAKETSCGR
jgi:AcrR family transcriptional regulator